jgi:hypothetical protein
MKALLVVLGALVAVVCVSAPTLAQTPTVGIFFDESLTRMDQDCPPGGGVDTAYVVANGFDAFLSAIEFAINYPPTMSWLGDLDVPPVTLGTTPNGIMEAFGLPLNGYAPIVVAKVVFSWNCDGCTVTNDPVVVTPHPQSGFVRGVDFPQYNMINAIGMTSLVCSTVPTGETTWGRVKALYGE